MRIAGIQRGGRGERERIWKEGGGRGEGESEMRKRGEREGGGSERARLDLQKRTVAPTYSNLLT